jgi:type I restriction enzyme R subunit
MPLVPVSQVVEEHYQEWLDEKAGEGIVFTADERKWLDAIKDHIATSLDIDREALEQDVPFKQMGGLGAAYQVFGTRLSAILDELSERLGA